MIPPRVVLDTSAYAHLRRGHTAVIDWLAAADLIFLPVVVLGELQGGFRAGSRFDSNMEKLSEFLSEPFVETFSVTPTIARRYGDIFAQLRSAGTPIPANDIWIAACALECPGHLLTFDSDFDSIEGLDVTVLS